MSAKGVLRIIEGGAYGFWCPGCNEMHVLHGWQFNEDFDKPTFSPSVLVRSGHYASSFKPGDSCWCTYKQEHPDEDVKYKCQRCHSFVREGRVEYLTDSTHELSGQSVELKPF